MNKHSYKRKEWVDFSLSVQKRDGFKCTKCSRKKGDVVLQAHHKVYKAGRLLWDYPLSDLVTLCKGCHAREHEIIEPNEGWVLIEVNDLDDLIGVCEKQNCNQAIRYEHVIYHPDFGSKIVGSTCVDYLTKTDIELGQKAIKYLKAINEFVKSNINLLNKSTTKKGHEYLWVSYSNHCIKIYGKENRYGYQIQVKQAGRNFYEYGKIINTNKKSIEDVLALGYIVLRGTITESEDEKEILRNIWRNFSA